MRAPQGRVRHSSRRASIAASESPTQVPPATGLGKESMPRRDGTAAPAAQAAVLRRIDAIKIRATDANSSSPRSNSPDQLATGARFKQAKKPTQGPQFLQIVAKP